jgi:uncharacterized protein YhaN
MRFAELDLTRYGRFEDCKLVFERRAADLHVVYGPNEAGKSTTMAAVSDLLFGFPHRTPFAFRFDTSLLRVGAVLEGDAGSFACRRRKSLKGSLIDAEDRPIDEAPLLAMLRGQTREVFRLSSSLDHERLREGGRAIVDAKDDLGRAVFAAGSGLVGVAQILDTLEAEIDGIWGRRAADKRAYTRAEREYEAAKRLLKNAELRPNEWKAARAELERLESEYESLETRRRDMNAELRKVERSRRVGAPIRRRGELIVAIEAHPVPILPPAMEIATESGLAAATDAERKRMAAAELLTDRQDRLDAVRVDRAILAAAEAIDGLVEARGAIQKAIEDLPRRQTELQARRETLHELRLELELPPVGDGEDRLPTRLAVATLRDLAEKRLKDEAAGEALRDEQERLTRHSDALGVELADAVVMEGLDLLSSAVKSALRLGDLDDAYAARARLATRAEEQRAIAFERLVPWRGSVAELARLVPPSVAEIDAVRDAIELAATEAIEEKRTAAAAEEELDRLRLEAASLSGSGQAVSVEQVAQARAARDGTWRELRLHIAGTGILADVVGESARFETLIHTADTLVDLRFLSAEASGRLSEMNDRAAILELQADQAQDRQRSAEKSAAEARRTWAERLAVLGLPDLSPSGMRTWRELRDTALAHAEAAQNAIDAARAESDRLEAAKATLRAALPDSGAHPDEFGGRLSVLLERAERRLEEGEKQAEAFRSLKQRAKAAEETLGDVKRRLGAQERARDAWRAAWVKALAEAGINLPVETAAARLELYERLRAVIEAVGDLQRRVTSIDDDKSRFDAHVATIAAQVGELMDGRTVEQVIDQLRARLTQARSEAQRHATLSEEASRYSDVIRAAEAERDAADVGLAAVMALTGTTGRAGVAAAVEASRHQRTIRDELAGLEREIIRQGDGLPLLELVGACEADDPDATLQRAETLERELATLAETITEVAHKAGMARTTFEQLDHGSRAADAAADAEQSRAEMDVQAEAYILKRTQIVMLRWAMERYREQRQNPLLKRAGELFSILTLGRYVTLRVDLESGQPRLLGMCDDGATLVEVDAMSEGTVDQLFLALRLAAVEQTLESGFRLPFLADDLFINFDDDRARAGFKVLAELARSTQVLFFTHHAHLLPIARDAIGADVVSICELR